MKLSQVGLQLYTLRDHCTTAADLASTARKLRSIGYTAVELGGLGPIETDEIIRIVSGEGLKICSVHGPSEEILSDPARTIDRVKAFGCPLAVYAWPAGIDFNSAESIEGLVRGLANAAAKFKAAGIQLCYHNHALEFVRYREKSVLEHILAQTEAASLAAELDTYWVHFGGGDVVDWCRRLKGRLPLLHLKDYGFTTENKPEFREIGSGSLRFPQIIAEAEQSGCRWFIVEQDVCPGDPFDSIRKSFEYIRQNLVA